MPIYEYTCTSGHSFEELVSSRDKERSTCPACGGEAHRVLSAPSPTPGSSAEPMAFGGCGREACMTGGCQGLGKN